MINAAYKSIEVKLLLLEYFYYIYYHFSLMSQKKLFKN